ncbi:unnamed protein product [Clavelina lepadiformis]|uniref:Uncharacterized protein n=1 Tax=Clavelina lepadiformis TaxID=159417 RepID=A0ABP0GQY7_CLALP
MHHHPQNQERALNLSILTVSGPGEPACFEHSTFFKVNVPAAAQHSVKSTDGEPKVRPGTPVHALRRTDGPEPKIQLRAF